MTDRDHSLSSDDHSILDAIKRQSGVDIEDFHKIPGPKDALKKLWEDGFGRFVLIGFVLMFVVTSFFGIKSLIVPDQWNPLGQYPNQTVLNDTEVIKNGTYNGQTIAGLPTVYLDELVEVRGSKENTTKKVVKNVGFRTWVSNLPPGAILASVAGSLDLQPGVSQFTFKNTIPQEVIDYVKKINKATIWHLHGEECPVRKNKDGHETRGQCRTWDTVNFVLIPTNRPDKK